MELYIGLIVSFVILTSETATAGLGIGVAASGQGKACVSFEDVFPPEGTVVTLIHMQEGKQRTFPARVTRPVHECVQLDDGGIPGPYFALAIPNEADRGGFVGIAVIGTTDVDSRGRVTADLDGVPPLEMFSDCTSSEGAHMTLWSGEPVSGKRLWHEYFGVDYATEPTCLEGETGEPGLYRGFRPTLEAMRSGNLTLGPGQVHVRYDTSPHLPRPLESRSTCDVRVEVCS